MDPALQVRPFAAAQATLEVAAVGGATDEVASRIAENESRFRASNERIEDAVLSLEPDSLSVPFVCECGRIACLQTVRLSIAEYESVRAHPTWFFCVPGHQVTLGETSRVCSETSTYVVIEKTGVAGAVAEATEPQSRRGATDPQPG